MKEKQPRKLGENVLRHNANLSCLDGQFYHGRFYKDGVAQLPKPKDCLPKGRERLNGTLQK